MADVSEKLRSPSDEVNRRGRAKYGAAWRDNARSPDGIDFTKLYPSNPLHGALMMGGAVAQLDEDYKKRVEVENELRDDLFEGRARAIVARDDGIQFDPPRTWWLSESARSAIGTGQHPEGCLWIAPQDYEVKSDTARQGKEIGGAPKKYDGEAYLLTAFKLLYEGFQPKTQTELRDRALEIFCSEIKTRQAKNRELPSEEWAKPKIRALWATLGLKGPG